MTADHLPSATGSPAGTSAVEDGTLEDSVNRYERGIIEEALRQTHGIQTRAAQRLGTTRRILRYRMDKLNIPAVPQPGGEPPADGE